MIESGAAFYQCRQNVSNILVVVSKYPNGLLGGYMVCNIPLPMNVYSNVQRKLGTIRVYLQYHVQFILTICTSASIRTFLQHISSRARDTLLHNQESRN